MQSAPLSIRPRPWIAFLSFVVLAIAYWWVAIQAPLHVGLWQDDATYVATARSLAEGTGYRHIQIPGEPFQTRYPPLYGAVLSLGFRIGPDYPANLPWLLIPNAVGAAALVVLSSLYWRRVFAAPSRLWVCATVLSAISPVLLGFVRYTMSDLLYGALAVGALYLVDRAPQSSEASRAAPDRGWLFAAVLVGCAVLTRGIGVTLLMALPLALGVRRRFAAAGIALAVAAAICLPWWVWQSTASEQNGPLQAALMTAAELNYGLWAPDDLMQSLRVIKQNLLRVVHDLAYYQLALPIGPSSEALARFGAGTVALFVVCFAATALCIIGFFSTLRGGVRMIHIYAVLYAGLVIAWPFSPHRFMVAWTPFILYFIVVGFDRFVRWLSERVMRSPTETSQPSNWQRGVGIVAASMVAVGFLVEDDRILRSRPDHYFMRELAGEFDLAEIDEVYAWVREHSNKEDVFAAAWSAGLFLNTGRQGHFLWPDSDPYERYYGEDREAWRFYGARSESELMSIYHEMAADFVATYGAAQVRYYVHQPHWLESRVMESVIEGNPRLFSPVFESSKGSYRVYQVRLRKAAKQGR